MFCNFSTQDSSTLMEHLFFSKVLLLLPNFPAGLTEAQRSQVTCLGQTASVAWNRLEPMILLSLYPALDHAPFYKLFYTRDILCPLFLLVFLSHSNPPISFICCFISEHRFKLFGGHWNTHNEAFNPNFSASWSPDPSLELKDLANISTSGVHISSTTSFRKKECNSFTTCALSNSNCY